MSYKLGISVHNSAIFVICEKSWTLHYHLFCFTKWEHVRLRIVDNLRVWLVKYQSRIEAFLTLTQLRSWLLWPEGWGCYRTSCYNLLLKHFFESCFGSGNVEIFEKFKHDPKRPNVSWVGVRHFCYLLFEACVQCYELLLSKGKHMHRSEKKKSELFPNYCASKHVIAACTTWRYSCPRRYLLWHADSDLQRVVAEHYMYHKRPGAFPL